MHACTKLHSRRLSLSYGVRFHVFHLNLVDKESFVLFLLHLAPLHVNLVQLVTPIIDFFFELGILLDDCLTIA